MSPTVHYVTILNEIVDTPAFAEPFDWYSNGRRGYLHIHRSCDKLDAAPITRQFTLRDALDGHTMCRECVPRFWWGTEEQRQTSEAARNLAQVLARVAEANVTGFDPVHFPALDASARRTRLGKLDASCGTDDERRDIEQLGLGRLLGKVTTAIAAATPEPPDQATLDDDLIRHSAAQLFAQRIDDDNAHDLWPADVVAVLGRPIRRDLHWAASRPDLVARSSMAEDTIMDSLNRLAWLAVFWAAELGRHGDPHRATETVLARCTRPDFPGRVNLDALEHLPADRTPERGETLGGYVTRAWEQATRAAAVAATTCWTEHVERRLDRSLDHVLVHQRTRGGQSHHAGPVVETVLGTVDWVSVNRNEYGDVHRAAICHPSLASYLLQPGIVRVVTYSNSTGVVPIDSPVTRDVLETALALWDPMSNDTVYRAFETALDAARNLDC